MEIRPVPLGWPRKSCCVDERHASTVVVMAVKPVYDVTSGRCVSRVTAADWLAIVHVSVTASRSNRSSWTTKCHLDPSSRLAKVRGPEKWGATAPPFFGGDGSPSNTISPGPRPTCIASAILIQPAVWPRHAYLHAKSS